MVTTGYSQRFSLVGPEGPSGDVVTKGTYQFIIHAPTWLPNWTVQTLAAIQQALEGNSDTAGKIMFGTYTVINKPNGDSTDKNTKFTSGTLTNLSQPHKDIVWQWQVKSDIGGWMLIAALILALLIVLGIIWLVLELKSAPTAIQGTFLLLAIAGVLIIVSVAYERSRAKPKVQEATL